MPNEEANGEGRKSELDTKPFEFKSIYYQPAKDLVEFSNMGRTCTIWTQSLLMRGLGALHSRSRTDYWTDMVSPLHKAILSKIKADAHRKDKVSLLVHRQAAAVMREYLTNEKFTNQEKGDIAEALAQHDEIETFCAAKLASMPGVADSGNIKYVDSVKEAKKKLKAASST